MHRSSRGPGYVPFTDVTAVRIRYGVPVYLGLAERPGGGLQNRPGRLDSCVRVQIGLLV